MRDPNKLTVFRLAHQQVLDVYRLTAALPDAERYHLQLQLRRAAVSVSTNIVEGCARASRGEYEHFLNIALGSAVEAAYLMDVASELGLFGGDAAEECRKRSTVIVRALHNLHASVRVLDRELPREPPAPRSP